MNTVTPPAPAQSYEAQVARTRLWTLPLLFVVLVFGWSVLQRRGLLPEAPYGSIWVCVLIWWLIEAAPRPFSVQAVMGKPPRRSDCGWIALLLFAGFCLRFAAWSARVCWNESRVPPAFSFSFDQHSTMAAVLSATLFAPVMEELLFRRTLFRKWRVQIGPVQALLLTTLIFSFHGDNVGSALMGLTLVLLYTSTGSLWAPILLHILNNALGVLLGYASPVYIGLETWWKLAGYVLLLLLGSAAWLWFVLRSWRTLGAALPPDSLQPAVAPASPGAPATLSAS